MRAQIREMRSQFDRMSTLWASAALKGTELFSEITGFGASGPRHRFLRAPYFNKLPRVVFGIEVEDDTASAEVRGRCPRPRPSGG